MLFIRNYVALLKEGEHWLMDELFHYFATYAGETYGSVILHARFVTLFENWGHRS
jgi:hypothetical protein